MTFPNSDPVSTKYIRPVETSLTGLWTALSVRTTPKYKESYRIQAGMTPWEQYTMLVGDSFHLPIPLSFLRAHMWGVE